MTRAYVQNSLIFYGNRGFFPYLGPVEPSALHEVVTFGI